MHGRTANTLETGARRSLRTKTGVALAAAGLLVTGAGWSALMDTTVAPAAVAAQVHQVGPAGQMDSYASIVDKVMPAVVTVRSERRVRTTQMPQMGDPMLREFFGDRFGQQMPRTPRSPRQDALGSGVIVSQDGLVLTNHHVVADADSIRVETKDRRTLTARLIGSDPPSDLAVLKIEGSGFPTVSLGDSNAVRVGDVVLAIGNPLGVGQTVTMGIISAKSRATGLGDGSFEDFLQTDAPINQGNSGGALVNTKGELIGINSQILSPSGGNIGIGFAIPVTMARSVMTQLIDHGSVQRGMLGVTVQTVTSEIAESLRLGSIEGALVSTVQPDGPADQAGVERGDVITKLNGAAIGDHNNLRNQVAGLKPGSNVALTVIRDGKEVSLNARLAELPGENRRAAGRDGGSNMEGGYGLQVAPLTPAEANRLETPGTQGLLIRDVDPDGPAARSGFQAGDIVTEVDGAPVTTVGELKEALAKSGARPALVLVARDGNSLFLTLGKPASQG